MDPSSALDEKQPLGMTRQEENDLVRFLLQFVAPASRGLSSSSGAHQTRVLQAQTATGLCGNIKTILEMMMHNNKKDFIRIGLFLLFSFLAVVIPSAVYAETEITGVIGGMVGGDLNNVIDNNFSVKSTFDNAPLYGARVGWVGRFFGVEGSFVDSPSGLSVSIPGFPVSLDARVYYLEANLLLIPIPGPISPFFTAGAGLHSYKFELNAGSVAVSGENTDVNKFGYNFGGGLKINIGHITFRGEVLDHVTPIGPGDFSIQDIIPGTSIDTNRNLHNVEISAGIGVRF